MDLDTVTRSVAGPQVSDGRCTASLVEHSTIPDIPFTGKREVAVRSIESLQRIGAVPAEIGVLKIDTEGFELEVLRGLGTSRPEVMAEFWDREMAFGRGDAFNALPDLVAAMRCRGYHWYVVLCHSGGDPVSFYCNRPVPVLSSWGNVVFFRDHPVFSEARQWCAEVLRPTYFGGALSLRSAPYMADDLRIFETFKAGGLTRKSSTISGLPMECGRPPSPRYFLKRSCRLFEPAIDLVPEYRPEMDRNLKAYPQFSFMRWRWAKLTERQGFALVPEGSGVPRWTWG